MYLRPKSQDKKISRFLLKSSLCSSAESKNLQKYSVSKKNFPKKKKTFKKTKLNQNNLVNTINKNNKINKKNIINKDNKIKIINRIKKINRFNLMGNKLIKDMDEETWRKFIAFCKIKGKNVNEQIKEVLDDHLKKNFEKLLSGDKR